LHDTVMQSLIGLEMQVHARRRQGLVPNAVAGSELEVIEEQLHDQISTLRDLIYNLRRTELAPSQLLAALGGQVEKFSRETGIAARFVSDLEVVRLSPGICREIVRML